MIEKHFINVGKERFVCLSYNWVKSTLVIGGFSNLRSDIDLILQRNFNFLDDIEFKFTQKNKLRVTQQLNSADFRRSFRTLNEDYECISTNSFDRQM